jgi:hypothetical protein
MYKETQVIIEKQDKTAVHEIIELVRTTLIEIKQ